jgi:hypothetical protein
MNIIEWATQQTLEQSERRKGLTELAAMLIPIPYRLYMNPRYADDRR